MIRTRNPLPQPDAATLCHGASVCARGSDARAWEMEPLSVDTERAINYFGSFRASTAFVSSKQHSCENTTFFTSCFPNLEGLKVPHQHVSISSHQTAESLETGLLETNTAIMAAYAAQTTIISTLDTLSATDTRHANATMQTVTTTI